jgi:hypothetical protein
MGARADVGRPGPVKSLCFQTAGAGPHPVPSGPPSPAKGEGPCVATHRPSKRGHGVQGQGGVTFGWFTAWGWPGGLWVRRFSTILVLGGLAMLAACEQPSSSKSPASAPAAGGASTAPSGLEAVGVNAAVRNAVTTHGQGESAWRPSVVQGAVHFMDEINTGQNSGLDVGLRDQSVLTLGADARLTVDKFVYDPTPGAAGVGFKVVKGVFRFASKGKGPAQPDGRDGVAFRTPTAAIGVRGTLFDGAVGPQVIEVLGDWAGGLHLAADPASATLVVLRQGEIEVRTSQRRVTLRVPGQAVVISGDRVSDPFFPRTTPARRLLDRLPPLPPGMTGPDGGAPGSGSNVGPRYPRGGPDQIPSGSTDGAPVGPPLGVEPTGPTHPEGFRPDARPPLRRPGDAPSGSQGGPFLTPHPTGQPSLRGQPQGQSNGHPLSPRSDGPQSSGPRSGGFHPGGAGPTTRGSGGGRPDTGRPDSGRPDTSQSGPIKPQTTTDKPTSTKTGPTKTGPTKTGPTGRGATIAGQTSQTPTSQTPASQQPPKRGGLTLGGVAGAVMGHRPSLTISGGKGSVTTPPNGQTKGGPKPKRPDPKVPPPKPVG